MPNVASWLMHPTHYFESHFWLIIMTGLIELVVASGVACLAAWIAVRHSLKDGPGRTMTTDPALWKGLFSSVSGKGAVPFVTVTSSDGSRIMGVVRGVDPYSGSEWGSLVIEEPIIKYSSENCRENTEGWQRVVLPFSAIRELWIRFVPDPKS
jgi:hypothetical protein